MRLSEDRIKQAILHPDVEIRARAITYFGEAHSPDLSVMPLVIQSVEKYGRKDADRVIGRSRDLRQSEATIAWVIDELNAEQSNQYENYPFNLSMVLIEADPALLVPREADVLRARHFLPELSESFSERLRMLSWDQATCWRELEELCEAGKDIPYINEFNLDRARSIVEALARHGEGCREKVLDLLSREVADYEHNPMAWLEPLAVRLAGLIHLDAAVPRIIAKLLADAGDLGNEECAGALVRIGTPAVLEAVAEAYPTAEDHFRIYASEPLERIHSDLAVEKCVRLFEGEKDRKIQTILATALLYQCAQEGIEAARRLLLGPPLGFEGRGLRQELLLTATLMGERFPEYDAWLAAEKAERAEHERRVQELESNPRGLLLYAMEKLKGKSAAEAAEAAKAKPSPPPAPRPLPPAPRLILPPQPEPKRKVGRNDPCPCGSGKKFKNCCLRK